MQSSTRPERYILCVDDDRDFLKSLEVFLPEKINGQEGEPLYHFLFIEDPRKALQTLEELQAEGLVVAMIVSDQQMPSMKGIDLLLACRRMSEASVRVLLTGHAGIEAAISAINERLLERYLTKPIDDQHGFAISMRQMLQRFEMSRVIETQAATLQRMYQFANRINSMTDIACMLGEVARFTHEALGCAAVYVETAHGLGHASSGSALPSPDVVSSLPLPRAAPGAAPYGRIEPGEELPPDLAAIVQRSGQGGVPAVFARLRAGEESLGVVLATLVPGTRMSGEADWKLLACIADTASIAIEKQRTWMRLEHSYRVTKDQARALKDANKDLRRLDELKGDFLRFISHELRTPLNHLSAVAMINEHVERKELVELTSVIHHGYERLDRFIQQGLEYLEWLGRQRMECAETADLKQVLLAEIEAQRKATSREVRWSLSLPGTPCHVRMPTEHIGDVVRVLLANALKFSPGTPRVSIEVRRAGEHLVLRVADGGRGFPSDVAERIFDPFTVLDASHHQEGTALNLARLRAKVTAFGGRVSATSRGFGQGAAFDVVLVAAPEQPQALSA